MIETTDQAFAEAIRAAVAERGEDYVYPREWRMGNATSADLDRPQARGTCRYARPDGVQGGACIIGAALQRVGVHVTDLFELDATAPGAESALAATVTGLSPRMIGAASTAQSHQDRELSWGLALEAFERELRIRDEHGDWFTCEEHGGAMTQDCDCEP
ncbi:hypothetical protein [Pseudonocardia sp. NPDC049154]|uniref:hypothetical protein n=1 Tax=Pseudonocardia sp. NPDC049154 TaxID=3155501 RepID=UPI00340926AF